MEPVNVAAGETEIIRFRGLSRTAVVGDTSVQKYGQIHVGVTKSKRRLKRRRDAFWKQGGADAGSV